MTSSLGFPVGPMKATLGTLPSGAGWAHEVKWDGYRTIVHVHGGQLRLESTAGHDVTARWPELSDLPAALNATAAILDTELTVLDDDGRPRFELVQQRGNGRREAVLQVFDVLSVNGTDTIALPYDDRRQLLDQVVEPGANWLVPAHHLGAGEALLAATADQGLEGVVSKRRDSVYRPGARTRDWVKVKNRHRVDVTIGGFTTGEGRRATTFGALLVGIPKAGALRFAGGVGTGLSQPVLEDLTDRMRRLVTSSCPFDPPPPPSATRGATWIRPELRATIEIAEFTNEGLVRHASYLQLQE